MVGKKDRKQSKREAKKACQKRKKDEEIAWAERGKARFAPKSSPFSLPN